MGAWPQGAIKSLAQLKAVGNLTYGDIAKKLSSNYPSKRFTAEAVRKKYKRFIEEENGLVVEFDGYKEIIPIATYPQVNAERDEIYNKYRHIKRLLVLSDLHIPHHDTQFIRQQVLSAKKWKAGLVVLAGDILDEGKFSSFDRGNVPYRVEHGIATALIREIANELDVVMVRGNHDIRLIRYLSKRVNSEEFSFLFGEMDPLAVIANELGIDYVPDWWCQIGPVIIAHPSRYSSVELKNIVNTIDYFIYRRRNCYWDTVAQGHSHKANSGLIRGTHYFEVGCSCKAIDYNFSPQMTGPVWTQAAAFIEIVNGKTDFNRSRLATGRTWR